jgi:hypothetical protein
MASDSRLHFGQCSSSSYGGRLEWFDARDFGLPILIGGETNAHVKMCLFQKLNQDLRLEIVSKGTSIYLGA